MAPFRLPTTVAAGDDVNAVAMATGLPGNAECVGDT